jgi:hypothetical protein
MGSAGEAVDPHGLRAIEHATQEVAVASADYGTTDLEDQMTDDLSQLIHPLRTTPAVGARVPLVSVHHSVPND